MSYHIIYLNLPTYSKETLETQSASSILVISYLQSPPKKGSHVKVCIIYDHNAYSNIFLKAILRKVVNMKIVVEHNITLHTNTYYKMRIRMKYSIIPWINVNIRYFLSGYSQLPT